MIDEHSRARATAPTVNIDRINEGKPFKDIPQDVPREVPQGHRAAAPADARPPADVRRRLLAQEAVPVPDVARRAVHGSAVPRRVREGVRGGGHLRRRGEAVRAHGEALPGRQDGAALPRMGREPEAEVGGSGDGPVARVVGSCHGLVRDGPGRHLVYAREPPGRASGRILRPLPTRPARPDPARCVPGLDRPPRGQLSEASFSAISLRASRARASGTWTQNTERPGSAPIRAC